MLETIENKVIALAGVLQAAHLVNTTAQRGMADQVALEASIGSVLKIDAANPREVFGGLDGVESGLHQIERQIGRERDALEQRYVISLLQLEGRLRARGDLVARVREGIDKAAGQAAAGRVTDPEVLETLATTYSDTISSLSPRIMVNGDPNLLNRPEIANRIRALLLAGVRAGVLWHQCGGRRLQLLLQARRTVNTARALLDAIYREGRA